MKVHLFTNLTPSLFSGADLLGHLHEHRQQAGLVLQLLPQSPATTVPQGSLYLTKPTLVVGVSVGILQQPAGILINNILCHLM